MEANVEYIEQLCGQLYEASDEQTRNVAEKTLSSLVETPECMQHCIRLLDRANSPYSQLVAATTLTKLLNDQARTLTTSERIKLKEYLLNYIARNEKLPSYVQTALCQLLSKLIKQNWNEYDKESRFAFQTAVGDILQSAQNNPTTCSTLVPLLFNIVSEMNLYTDFTSISKQRRVAASFRDTYLFDIFKFSISMLEKVKENASSLDPQDETQVLSCLVQLASIRRTMFNNAERQDFLVSLVTGIRGILENFQKVSDQAVYHELCRLIARLKSNYQLSELIRVEDYATVIQLIADFTIKSLQMHQFSANSVHYLLSFWQRLVSSMPYIKSTEPHLLTTYVPMVSKAYIESRLTLVSSVMNENLEDPLDDHTLLSQQLEQMSAICRCEYDNTTRLLIQLFDQMAVQYQQAINAGRQMELVVEEGCLTWLVLIIGAAVGGRVSFSANEEHDESDGDMICRVMQLMQLTDSRLPERGCKGLEFAYVWFLEQFRKVYITDQVQKQSKAYNKLSETVGLKDEGMILAFFVRKIVTNLKYWSTRERLVDDTLALLNDLSIGYSSVRKLIKLDEIRFLMENHTADHFSFLGTSVDTKTMKSRTTFYTALTRLLTADIQSEDDEKEFRKFVGPLDVSFNQLNTFFSSMNDAALVNHVEAKKAVIGLARDIRGIAYASNTRSSYSLLFEWLYPKFFLMFVRAIQIWHEHPDLTTPILRLYAELSHNRSQRLHFDVTSPNAFLLFKEVSKMLKEYGSRCGPLPNLSSENFYQLRLKGVMVCFSVLKNTLCGAYVNFAVFRLYQDNCLDEALQSFLNLLSLIPQNEIFAYNKLCQTYFFIVEQLAKEHIAFLSRLDVNAFHYLIQTVNEGLTSLDTIIATGCCAILDSIVSYIYKRVCNGGIKSKAYEGIPEEGECFLRHREQYIDCYKQILSYLVNQIMQDKCRNQWSMSRPLLGLILLNEEYFTGLSQEMINSQPADKQAQIRVAFGLLMEGVERSLSVRNRDRFTQNLSAFRREVMDCLTKSPTGNSIPNVQSMSDVMS